MEKRTFELWTGKPPLAIEGAEIPVMTYYRAERRSSRGAVIIFAGGAYMHRAVHEGEGYALYLNEIGIDAFVVDYRVLPYRFPAALIDARRAIRVVKSLAKELDLDEGRLAVMGSSAGGHLAAMAASYRGRLDGEGEDATDEIDESVAGQILCYPVLDSIGHRGSYVNLFGEDDLTEENLKTATPSTHVGEHTPPSFIWHTSSDPGVNVGNTYRYADALNKASIPVELHVYPIGNHGLGLANREGAGRNVPYVQRWAEELRRWLDLNGFMN